MKNKNDAEQNKKYIRTILKDYRLYLILLPIIIWYVLWFYKPIAGLLDCIQILSTEPWCNG